MSRQTSPPERPDHKKTYDAIQHAYAEVEHALRPRRDGMLAWLAALGAGAVVAWRGFRAAIQDAPAHQFNPRAFSQFDYPARRRRHADREDDSRTAPLEPGGHLIDARHDQRCSTGRAGGSSASAGEPNAADVKANHGIIGLGKEFIARYNDADCPARAAALSFFGILSLVPLLLFAMAALGFFIRDPDQTQQYVEHAVATLLPGREAMQAAEQVIRQTHLVESARSLMEGKWWTVLVGVLSLIYTALGLFVSATDPMNAAWEVMETRSFIRLRVVCLEVFAGAGLFFLLSLAVSSGLWHPAGAPWIVNALLSACYEALAVALNAAMFTLIYRFLPNAKVTWRAAAFGGVVTGILYEVVKKGFELYLSHFGNVNNKMYGALGGIVLLVTWIYYGSMLLLAGAIIAKMFHEHIEEGGVRRHSRDPQRLPHRSDHEAL